MSKILAWHFVGTRLRDGSPIPADGKWLEFPGKCVICESGLHASREPFDASQYARGEVLCLVECEQIEEEHNDKFVCHWRKIIARKNIAEILRWFARMQALSMIHLWPANPPDVVLDWLMTGDESLRVAAWSLAWSAVEFATCYNARCAIRVAAWSATKSAGLYIIPSATRVVAQYKSAARAEFNKLIRAEFAEFL